MGVAGMSTGVPGNARPSAMGVTRETATMTRRAEPRLDTTLEGNDVFGL
jgi:hypothetical protein